MKGIRAWRLPALVALPVALGAAVFAVPDLEPAVSVSDPVGALVEAERDPGVDPDDTTIWFCPGVVGDHQLSLANVSDAELTAKVRVADPTGTETVKAYIVGPGSIRAVAVNEFGVEAGPSAAVEADGPGLIVTHEMIDEAGPARANCSTSAAKDFFVPGGDTSDGANDNVVFYNPFPADAVIEVDFVTRDGTRPDSAEVLVRGRRSARLSAIREVPLESVLAIDANAVSGNVVAQRVARTSRERTGLSMSLVADAPATSWAFAVHAPSGASERYLIYNPSDSDAAVDVDVLYDDIDSEDNERIQVEPFQLDLIGRSVEELDLSAITDDRLPRDRPHTVVIRSVADVPVLVDQVVGGVNGIGLAVTGGQTSAAESWIHTVTDSSTQFFVQNPGDSIAEVRFVSIDGESEWHNTTIELRPRTRQVVELDGLGPSEIVQVDADQPIISAQGTRSINDEGDTSAISARPGIAVAGTTSPIPGS